MARLRVRLDLAAMQAGLGPPEALVLAGWSSEAIWRRLVLAYAARLVGRGEER